MLGYLIGIAPLSTGLKQNAFKETPTACLFKKRTAFDRGVGVIIAPPHGLSSSVARAKKMLKLGLRGGRAALRQPLRSQVAACPSHVRAAGTDAADSAGAADWAHWHATTSAYPPPMGQAERDAVRRAARHALARVSGAAVAALGSAEAAGAAEAVRALRAAAEQRAVEAVRAPGGGAWRGRCHAAVAQLERGLVERGTEARLVLLSLLSGEHLLLLGPPGTAKSLLLRRLSTLLDAEYFERQLTRFSTPEELYGPLSLSALREDRYERMTAGYLPQAQVAFIDEVFKANSAILNSLLGVMNERVFDNGAGARTPVPLVCLVGASNEAPEDDELEALHDRFLLRRTVQPVSLSGRSELLELRPDDTPFAPDAGTGFTVSELDEMRAAATAVVVPADVIGLVERAADFLATRGSTVSDRRLVKVMSLLRVVALTSDRGACLQSDCYVLRHTLCDNAADEEALEEWLAAEQGGGHDELTQVQFLLRGVLKRAVRWGLRQDSVTRGAGGNVGTQAAAARPAGEISLEQIAQELASLQGDVHRPNDLQAPEEAQRFAGELAPVASLLETKLSQACETLRSEANALDESSQLWLEPAELARLAQRVEPAFRRKIAVVATMLAEVLSLQATLMRGSTAPPHVYAAAAPTQAAPLLEDLLSASANPSDNRAGLQLASALGLIESVPQRSERHLGVEGLRSERLSPSSQALAAGTRADLRVGGERVDSRQALGVDSLDESVGAIRRSNSAGAVVLDSSWKGERA